MPFQIKKPGQWYTSREIAEIRGVAPRTANDWFTKGWLPGVQIFSSGERLLTWAAHEDDLANFTPPLRGPKSP